MLSSMMSLIWVTLIVNGNFPACIFVISNKSSIKVVRFFTCWAALSIMCFDFWSSLVFFSICKYPFKLVAGF